jgi:hypothetical protein
MRKLYLAASLMVFLTPILGVAQSPFDGTWKWNANDTDWSKKPNVVVLKDGMYRCEEGCVPKLNIKADGTDQKVADYPYYDTVAIKVVSDHEIEETDKKNGKVVVTSKTTLSPDGNTLMFEFTDSSNTNAAPVTGKGEAMRVAKGPAGSSPLSGSWRMKKIENLSDNAVTWTYKVNGDELTMTTPTGQSYTAKMDGTDAPFKGDPGTTSVSVRKIGKDTIEETDKRNGKVIGVVKSTVSPDGKSMRIVFEDKQTGRTSHSTATKQSM